MSLTGLLFWASRPQLPAIATYAVAQGAWGRTGPADARSLRVLSLNMHFGVGPAEPKPLPTESELRANLERIGALIANSGADVVALQEIDFGSRRTHHIDMVPLLAARAGLPFMARALCWKKNYLPFPYWPPRHHWGRIESGLAVLSRYPLSLNRMYLLPKPAENSRLYNLFYIDRGVQIVDVAIGTRSLRLFNLHLEAFKMASRLTQARLMLSLVRAQRRPLMLVAGDFNALPPRSRKTWFEDEPENDFTGDTTMNTVFAGLADFREIEIDGHHEAESTQWTFPSETPARRLDYLFHSAALHRTSGGVVHAAGTLSDHLPLFAEFQLPEPAGV